MARSDNSFSEFRLTAIRYGAEGISLFELTPVEDITLPSVSAGSHLDVKLKDDLIRQYSLITPLCDQYHYTLGVKREGSGRGGSLWLHDQLKVGDTVALGEPRNHFALNETSAPVVLLAGGIGITPIYSMYRQLKSAGRPVQLHYWARTAEQALFYQELQGDDQVQIYLNSDDGKPTQNISTIAISASTDSEIYCCGPATMIDELDSLADQLGNERVFVERFQADVPDTSDNEGFTVVLAKSGQEIPVLPGVTILDALRDEGIDVMYSCEQGICGACEQRVVDGTPEHHDSVASAETHRQNGTIMICCSTSASPRMVLDI